MQKTEFIVIIGIVQSYLAKWWERLNFSNIDGENIRKSIREKKVEWCDWEEEKMNFGNDITKIHSTAQALPVKCPSGSARMIYQLWNPSCWNCRELRREKIWIVATKLPKMGGKKKSDCQNLGSNKNGLWQLITFTISSQQITSDWLLLVKIWI